jgi:internalin A
VPAELFAENEDHLAALRAHFRDLDQEPAAEVTDIKLLVLGNGQVGKTQLVRRLSGESFQANSDSTHGILVSSASLPARAEERPITLHIWDFGGQDIYHGTHALFVRTRAVFLILWAKDLENRREYELDGLRFRNYPLRYWVEYIRHLGERASAELIVQTRCDTPGDEMRRFPVEPSLLEALGYCKELHYSALNDRGRAALDEALRDAVGWLRDPARMGTPMIGAGRMRVQRRLKAMREADQKIADAAQRCHRTLTQEDFVAICEKEGGVSEPAQLLQYLNNCDVVFYRKGLFNDAIVLDHAWALDAIYAVFNRERCYRQLNRSHGRFTRPLLEALV